MIRRILPDELPAMRDFAPKDWNVNLEDVFRRHFTFDYFHPLVAINNSEIVGTGIAVVNENATWLGGIIVNEEFRKNGIGTAITNQLIDYSNAKGVSSVILTASEMGLPIYEKIGFRHDFYYLFFKAENVSNFEIDTEKIFQIQDSDYDKIFELDYSISGEKRTALLQNFLKTGYTYKDDGIRGFYLPDFGNGLVLAENNIAGIELLKYRLLRETPNICIPETNVDAIEFIESIGFKQYFKSSRMYLNSNVNCKSNQIFLRGCGYLG